MLYLLQLQCPKEMYTMNLDIGRQLNKCFQIPFQQSVTEMFAAVQLLSHVRLFFNLMDNSPPSSYVHGIFPGKNSRVGCHFLFQGIYPTQGLNPSLLHWQGGSLPLKHQGSPMTGLRPSKYSGNCEEVEGSISHDADFNMLKVYLRRQYMTWWFVEFLII